MRTLYVLSFTALLGCNLATDPPPDNHASAPAAPGPAPCTQLPTEPVEITNEAEFIAEASGKWTICDQSAFGTNDDAGIEILANHQWYTLYDNAGQLVRATTPDKKGHWSLSFVWPHDPQITLSRETGGYNPMGVAIGENPRMMYLENSGFFEGWYQWTSSN